MLPLRSKPRVQQSPARLGGEGAALTATIETTVFRHLLDSEYPANGFDTGHPAYDRFLDAAKEWQPDYRAFEGTTVGGYSPRDAPAAHTREGARRERDRKRTR